MPNTAVGTLVNGITRAFAQFNAGQFAASHHGLQFYLLFERLLSTIDHTVFILNFFLNSI